MNDPMYQPLPSLSSGDFSPYSGLIYEQSMPGIFGGSAYQSLNAAGTAGFNDLYNGTVTSPGFMPGSVTPGTTPPAAGSWLDKMNGAWSQYGDMIQGIGGILQGGIGIYGMLQNINLARKSFEHQRKGDILNYNMMVQNQRNYQEDREDINAGAAAARGRKVKSESERMAEVDRKSVAMWS